MSKDKKDDQTPKTKIKPYLNAPMKMQVRMSALAGARGLYHGEGQDGADKMLETAAKFEEYILKGLKT